MNQKVYVVGSGGKPVGVYTSLEKAEGRLRLQQNPQYHRVHEVEMDVDTDLIERGYLPFRVGFSTDGAISVDRHHEFVSEHGIHDNGGGCYFLQVLTSAPNSEIALHKAFQIRDNLVAAGQWPPKTGDGQS